MIADPQAMLQLLVFDMGSNPDAARRPGHAKPFPLFACSLWEFHCCRLTCAVQIFYARLQGMQTAAQPSLQTQGCPLPLMLSAVLFTLVETVRFFPVLIRPSRGITCTILQLVCHCLTQCP